MKTVTFLGHHGIELSFQKLRDAGHDLNASWGGDGC